MEEGGKELLPLEWHEAISKIPRPSVSGRSSEMRSEDPILIDCRNTYETDVGKFEQAIPLKTTFFKESWTALEELLQNKPKNTPIYTYCTGGIRCVKINAFLEQKLGFQNTYRLKGGIIAYRRELEKSMEKSKTEINSNSNSIDLNEISRFKGVNYVFDERIGARITEDVLTSCELCGQVACDTFFNCPHCNVSYVFPY